MAKNYVCDGAKIECELCTKPEGKLVVTSNEVKIQDKLFANSKDKEKINLIFEGNCKKSWFQASPCASVIKPEKWQDVGDLIVQDSPALLESSTIMCAYGGVPIKITDHLQKSEPTQLQPVSAPVLSPSFNPTITALEWKSNKEVEDRQKNIIHTPDETIEKTTVGTKVWLEVLTHGIMPGEQLYIEVKEESEIIATTSAYVNEEGKVIVGLNSGSDEEKHSKLTAKAIYNESTTAEAEIEVLPPPKVLVNFRPYNSFKGEFGFDWLRMGDTGLKGDVWYRDILGSYSTGSFVKDTAEYTKLGKKYEMPNHPIKANDKYVVPVLTILPTKKAKLSLKVEVVEEATKIEFKYNKTFFKLNQTEVSHKTKGKKTLADYLEIECIKEFGTDQYIEVLADGNFAGKLKVLANDKAHRYKADIVLVEVATKIGSTTNIGSSTGREKEFTKYFNQALANAKYDSVTLDLSKDTTFNTNFAPSGTLTGARTNGFQDHLIAALKKQHKKNYSKYFKIFLINEAQGGLYGRAYGIPSTVRSVIVLRPGLTDSTLAHETFHAMGLSHSFSDNGEFTFEKNKTENIMDYSDIATPPIPVISTWQWQWTVIHGNIDKEK